MITRDNGSIRILVVDDEKPVLNLYKDIIGKIGTNECYDLKLCSESPEAIETVKESLEKKMPFSLVFMDINLGSDKDGLWTAKEIRKLDPFCHIVFVTGRLSFDTMERSRQIPPPDQIYFLQKPFAAVEIMQFVNSLGARWYRDREYMKIKDNLKTGIRQRTAELQQTSRVLEEEIQKRQHTKEALRKKEEHYRNIIEKNADAMIIIDDHGIVQYMNSASERLFGRRPEHFVGKTFGFPIISDEPTEIEILRKNGSVIIGEMRMVEMEWNGKKSYINSIRDITQRKEMEIQLKESLAKYEKTIRGTIQAMSAVVEKKDPYTSGHQAHVEKIAVRIAEKMQLSEKFIEGLSMSAMIHDIGKIAIPAEILSNPKRLTNVEFQLIQTHSQIGYEILKNIDAPWPIARIIFQHHERVDGTGYPSGIKKEEILFEARIISVADSLDAMGSHRPYRPSLGRDYAIKEVVKNKGVFYDPDVVDAGIRLFEEGCLFDQEKICP